MKYGNSGECSIHVRKDEAGTTFIFDDGKGEIDTICIICKYTAYNSIKKPQHASVPPGNGRCSFLKTIIIVKSAQKKMQIYVNNRRYL